MNTPLNPAGQGSSTRPYLIRALHDWCIDNGFTPYLAVYVDETVRVPMEYVKNREIVLNVSFDATSGLTLGNEFIEFKARFGGVARDILVPVDHVVAIYARENGQGMAFPVPMPAASEVPVPRGVSASLDAGPGSGPSLSVVPPSSGTTSPPVLAAGRRSRRGDEGAPIVAKAPRATKGTRVTTPPASSGSPPPPAPSPRGRPALKRVK